MARKSRSEQFAALENEDIREQIPSKIMPLIEQLVTEQCIAVNAATALRMKMLEIRVEELEKRLGIQQQEQDDHDPWDDWVIELEEETEITESPDSVPQESWDESDENDDVIPF